MRGGGREREEQEESETNVIPSFKAPTTSGGKNCDDDI